MRIYIGTDHRGVELKKYIIQNLSDLYEFFDMSPTNEPTDDFPDFAFKVSKAKVKDENSVGVLICGSGIGMSIAANKVNGIRCALIHNKQEAILSRSDDDANVIALSSSINPDEAVKCINAFIKTNLNQNEKYARRIRKIIDYENGEYNEL